MDLALKSYKKEFEYSYALGAFPTIELLKARPETLIKVLVSGAWRDADGTLGSLCRARGIEPEQNDKAVSRISPKENCFVIGVFKKYSCMLDLSRPHVALDNPSNMGNLGTIIRTMLGFGVRDLAVIGGGADILDPRAVRASMGALFCINFEHFESAQSYAEKCKNRDIYPFMLDGAQPLGSFERNKNRPFTLVFGNEAAGLGGEYKSLGQSVVIKHSNAIDSLNLSIAAGIALYEFTKDMN